MAKKTPFRSRARAARALAAVMQGQSLDQALPSALAGAEPRDQGFIRALCYGVLRDQRLLKHMANQLLARPLKADRNRGQAELLQLICCGLFQLRSMRVPAHAAVAETVDACQDLGQQRARGLINAVLRRYQREAEQLEAQPPEDAGITYSHPEWMVQRIRQDWPHYWQAILTANQTPGPMVLRVNARQQTRERYRESLQTAGMQADIVDFAPQALRLEAPIDVTLLPGFAEGQVSVQDSAAQLAAPLLLGTDGRQGHLRVLDACAAPGGKTAHLLELQPDLQLTALDQDAERLKRVTDNLQRLQLAGNHVRCLHADAADPESWWDGTAFDRILLDAPCSGSGVIRRHPDIKWLRRASDIEQLASEQLHLLAALWPLLSNGGILLYATCSIFKTEGEEVIQRFLDDTADATAQPLLDTNESAWGLASGAGRVILPGATDGFFYARLQKTG